jgi:cysteine synthase
LHIAVHPEIQTQDRIGATMHITPNMLPLIGNTPLVRLNRVAADLQVEVLAKAEYLNPSGSLKDRIALRMIDDAERAGRLRPGMTIVEASTGNTATALAFVGAIKGYRVHLYIPSVAASEERMRIMKAYGATIALVDAVDDMPDSGALHGAVVEKTPRQRCLDAEQADPENIWWARQSSNPSNPLAHEEGTCAEILQQTAGRLNAFVAAIGTGGTLLGCGNALRKHNAAILIAAVEPRDQAMINDGKFSFGAPDDPARNALLAELTEKRIPNHIIHVEQQEAIDMAHRLAEEEGLFCGLSGGANVFAALQLARTMTPGQRVVTILPDSRDRYLFNERFTT